MRYLAIPVLLAVVFIIGCASPERRSGSQAPQTGQAIPAAVLITTETAVQQASQSPKPAEIQVTSSAVTAEPPKIETPPPEAERMHKVWIFESLWSISKKYYGDGSLWPLIYEANKDQIANPRKIYPKQELVIPALK